MPVTQIQDKIVPEIFTPYVIKRTMELSNFVQSGVMEFDSRLNEFLSGGGITINMPSSNDLSNEDENISNDDPADKSTPSKITAGQEVAVRLSRNMSWSNMDLASALSGDNSMDTIASLVVGYWLRRQQKAVLATLSGVVADNVANDAGDYVRDVTGLAGDASLFSPGAFLDASQTLGDADESVGIVACHSLVRNRMRILNLIDDIPDARGEVIIPTYLGKRLIVDDSLFTGSGATLEFQTYLFGPGLIQAGMGVPEVPTGIDRDESAGNGSGQSTLHSRLEWCFHPKGHAYIGAASQGGPTNAVLATAASWDRVSPERKQIPLAVLKSKG